LFAGETLTKGSSRLKAVFQSTAKCNFRHQNRQQENQELVYSSENRQKLGYYLLSQTTKSYFSTTENFFFDTFEFRASFVSCPV
jgi:hypothetical protein